MDATSIPSMAADQIALLQSDRMIYIKPGVVEGRQVVTLHTTEGAQIGWAPDRATAFAALRQQDLEPVSVH